MSDARKMYVILRWQRYGRQGSWPTPADGSILDDLTEAQETAAAYTRRARACGRPTRHTVHEVSWPPVYDTSQDRQR